MKFDFEKIFERHGKDALAVDGLGKIQNFTPNKPEENFSSIPLWVADMNFATAPSITEKIISRATHPLFGYFQLSDDYFNSIIFWQKVRNGITNLNFENIGYENGVLGGVLSALNVLCSKGDNILIHSPTYVGFEMSLKNNGYNIIHSELYRDEKNIWRMNFDDMEQKIVENKIHTALICSPHNPCGRVWEKFELEQAFEIFERHNVFVISDEIWSDLIFSGHKHIPTQQINSYAREHTISFYSPSKTFNLSGIVGAYHIIYNSWLRDRMEKETSLSHYNETNVFSMHALIGAYSEIGMEWLQELNSVLEKNLTYAYDFITKNFLGVKVSKVEGTYMLFIDCENFCKENKISHEELLKKFWSKGITLHDGNLFNAPQSFRLSLAIPFSMVEDAFYRMKKYIFC